MRKSIRLLLILAVLGGELIVARPARAEYYETTYDGSLIDSSTMKKRRRQQNAVFFGILGCVGAAVGIFMALNAFERRAQRAEFRRRMRERQEKGLL